MNSRPRDADLIERLCVQIETLQNLVKEYKARNREVLRQENDDVFPGFRGNNDGG